MTGNTRLILAVLGIMAIGAWILAGCGGGANGAGRLQVSLVDAPLEADAVNIFIKSIDVNKGSTGSWWTIKQYDTPLKVNLLDFASDNPPLLLADAPLTSGHYTQIRLMLTSAEVVKGDRTYNVDLRNIQQTGVKCNGQIVVSKDEVMAVIMDFNAKRSFVNNPPGSNNYMLHPTLTMSPVSVRAELTGRIEVKDEAGTVQPIPDNAIVNVYTAGQINDETYLVSSTVVETDGTFEFTVLPAGTYDIRVMFGTTGVKDITAQAVASPSTDLGTIAITIQ